MVLRGVKTKTALFTMRLSYAGRAAHRAFLTQGQEAFLEGHVYGFERLMKAMEVRPSPASILARLEKIVEAPAVDGFKKLADVNRAEVGRRAEELRQASIEQDRAARRTRLHESAAALFTTIANRFMEAIESNAPTAEIERDAGRGKMYFVAKFGNARCGIARPAQSSSTRSTPFTVISEAAITVNLVDPVRGWKGRSHSLWFCDAKEEGRFAWHELAFMDWAGGTYQPEVVPYPLTADGGHIAFQPIMGTTQLAWPVEELDRSELDEFMGRWLGWFADAAAGRLQRPMMLPEKNAEGSWRRANWCVWLGFRTRAGCGRMQGSGRTRLAGNAGRPSDLAGIVRIRRRM